MKSGKTEKGSEGRERKKERGRGREREAKVRGWWRERKRKWNTTGSKGLDRHDSLLALRAESETTLEGGALRPWTRR